MIHEHLAHPPSSLTSHRHHQTRLLSLTSKGMSCLHRHHRRTREQQKVMGEEKKGCERCREWQEHYYMEHMDMGAKNIRFVKIMTGDFEHRISIPEMYADSLRARITKGFTLKAPSGETWRVDVTDIEDRLFFLLGWEDFVRAHELEENDILFFRCSGSHSFDVLIFNANGCEKVSSFFTEKGVPCMRKHFDNIVRQQAEEHRLLTGSDDVSVPLMKLVGSPNKASTSKKLSGMTKPREEPESPNSSEYQLKGEATEEEEGDDDHAESNKYYSRSASYLTEEEHEEIFRLASVKSGNPACVTILQKSHVRRNNHILVIPSKFAAEHLVERSHEILLLRPNRNEKWYVRYYHASSTQGLNGMLWAKFVRDNKLREGYICIFELIKGARKTTMMVHVIHKDGDGRYGLLG